MVLQSWIITRSRLSYLILEEHMYLLRAEKNTEQSKESYRQHSSIRPNLTCSCKTSSLIRVKLKFQDFHTFLSRKCCRPGTAEGLIGIKHILCKLEFAGIIPDIIDRIKKTYKIVNFEKNTASQKLNGILEWGSNTLANTRSKKSQIDNTKTVMNYYKNTSYVLRNKLFGNQIIGLKTLNVCRYIIFQT